MNETNSCKGLPIFHVKHNWEEISRRTTFIPNSKPYLPYNEKVLILAKECSGCKETWVLQCET